MDVVAAAIGVVRMVAGGLTATYFITVPLLALASVALWWRVRHRELPLWPPLVVLGVGVVGCLLLAVVAVVFQLPPSHLSVPNEGIGVTLAIATIAFALAALAAAILFAKGQRLSSGGMAAPMVWAMAHFYLVAAMSTWGHLL